MNDRPKMNQRLSAIKQQAHLYALDQEWYVDSFEQRFAELIIRECVHIAYNKMAVQKRDGIQPSAVCDAIREHFGVEE